MISVMFVLGALCGPVSSGDLINRTAASQCQKKILECVVRKMQIFPKMKPEQALVDCVLEY